MKGYQLNLWLVSLLQEIIHQEIKVKKTIILTLLLITALAANGCGNKKNVTDMKDKETTVSAVQQETTQLRTQETTTGLTMDSETQQEETTEEESKTVVATEVTDSSQTVYETAPQVAEPDNNSFVAGYAKIITVFSACNCPVEWNKCNCNYA